MKSEWNENYEFSLNLSNTSKYSWKCSKKHVWDASLGDRKKGVGCPYCDYRKVSKDNNLAKTNPKLMKYYSKENKILPTEITKKYGKRVLWECKKNHSWISSVGNRVKGRNCPYCYKEKNSQNK